MKNNIKKYVFFSLFTQACLLTISGQEIKNISDSYSFNNKDNENINKPLNTSFITNDAFNVISKTIIDTNYQLDSNLSNYLPKFYNLTNEHKENTLSIISSNSELNFNYYQNEFLISLFISLITLLFYKIQSYYFINIKNKKQFIKFIKEKIKITLKFKYYFFLFYKKIKKLYFNLYFSKSKIQIANS